MTARRIWFWSVCLFIAGIGLAGCEPYMSMTDQAPAQTRRAAALLPESPAYVGMVEVGTVLTEIGTLRNEGIVDSMRQVDHPDVQAFLDATGIDLETDVEAAYAALEKDEALSVVLFADVGADALDRYLAQAPDGAGRATTYRGAPLYRLALRPPEPGQAGRSVDTLSVAVVDNGTLAVGREARRVRAMVDRARDDQGGLQDNEEYMTLVERVGRGSTAWLAGRNVLASALGDSTATDTTEATTEPDQGFEVSRAGLQGALAEWSGRVLGLSEVGSLEERAPDDIEQKVNRLKRYLREQAVSITLTDAALDGEIYLTMQDEASASSVVDVAEGAVAVLKLSGDNLDKRHRDLLDGIQIERTGAIVRVRFSLDRDRLRDTMRAQVGNDTRRQDSTVHPATLATRRSRSITRAVVQ